MELNLVCDSRFFSQKRRPSLHKLLLNISSKDFDFWAKNLKPYFVEICSNLTLPDTLKKKDYQIIALNVHMMSWRARRYLLGLVCNVHLENVPVLYVEIFSKRKKKRRKKVCVCVCFLFLAYSFHRIYRQAQSK